MILDKKKYYTKSNCTALWPGLLLCWCTLVCLLATPNVYGRSYEEFYFQQAIQATDTTDKDSTQTYTPTTTPTYQQQDRFGDPFNHNLSPSPLLLGDPASLSLDAEIDTSMNYTVFEKIGDIYYRPTTSLSFGEFDNYMTKKIIKDGWHERSDALDGVSATSDRNLLPRIYFSPVLDRIFGGSYLELQRNGFVTLDFGGRWQRIFNPSIPIRQQRNGGFEFDQQISMNVVGKIGEKLAVTANFDNNNSFDFENDLKVEFTGYEEDIIKKLEIGNVSLPLNNSLIQGASNLFGIKAQLQFGKLFVTTVMSSSRGRSETLSVEGGFQGREFEVRASDYDDNRHFFLGHFFRNNFETWLRRGFEPTSGIQINRIEVYAFNRTGDTETLRNFAAFMDLGEGQRVFSDVLNADGRQETDNGRNILFQELANLEGQGVRGTGNIDDILRSRFNFERATDFEVVTSARQLQEGVDYTVNEQLGYISLLRRLQNDEVLGVAFEYSFNGQVFQVGELSADYANRPDEELIFLKMLRPSKIDVTVPTWDLMMKNIYNLNASQITREGFELRVIYRDDATGIDNDFLKFGQNLNGIPLIRVMALDRLNPNNDLQPDGNFDFIEGITVDSRNGNIIFPVLEPFGPTLENQFNAATEQNLIDRFVFDTLYRTTKADAQQITRLNKYYLKGRMQAGSTSEIVLPGINIAENSVRVSAGNTPLTEGIDYTVDYNFGKVRILNEGVINSGKQIFINYEKADLFNFQNRTLLGTRLDYQLSDDINFGATVLRLNEQPLISRVSIGDEPTRNLKYGLDVNVRKDSRFLTKILDALPLINTKEMSSVTFSAEFAQLVPGTSNVVDGEGTSYIDDFEAAVTPFNLMSNVQNTWRLASTPLNTDFNLDQSNLDTLGLGFRRAKMSWYVIDNIFYRTGGIARPTNITPADLDNNYIRAIGPQEVFPFRDRNVLNTNETVFDIAYYPNERGPYNYNLDEMQVESAVVNGVNKSRITLDNPERNWGGITRAITSDVDFDKTNIEYIEFWLMDPFLESVNNENGRVDDGFGTIYDNTRNEGVLVFNLGSISEDLMDDGRHAFENGLPADYDVNEVDQLTWGRVTRQQFLTPAFDNSLTSRPNQDVGFDGLKSEDEFGYFINDRNTGGLNPQLVELLEQDGSGDDFQYYLGDEFDANDVGVLERYKNFNGLENNSPVATDNSQVFTPSSTNLPDNEDLNNDNTISDVEEYYEYRVPLSPAELNIRNRFIVDQIEAQGTNGELVNWYLFRIPIREPDNTIGNINGFKSIRFMRMYMTQFEQPVVLRMVKFQLVGSQWRRFLDVRRLREEGIDEIQEVKDTEFTISVVNIEENGQSVGGNIPYVLPPGINRDRDNTSTIERRRNEQAMQLCVEDLAEKDARAAFKNVTYNLINYGKLQMFIHAQAPNEDVDEGEVTAFLRLGTDFTENYYEIEVPLTITPQGTAAIPEEVWPSANEIDIAFSELYALKSRRDRLNQPLERRFLGRDSNDKYNLYVRGRPDLSSVQMLMIGMRNPSGGDDEDPKTVCIWVNELRVSDFDKTKGWATNARLSAKLADVGTVNASTRYTSIGFGGIQQRISERIQEETFQYDISANLNVDKLFPQSFGLRIPMFVSYEKTTVTPRFDPFDPDIELDDALLGFDDEEERERYRDIVTEETVRRSLNFTNVRKVKTKQDAKSNLWDIENFSFTYSYSDENSKSHTMQSYIRRNYRGSVGYVFSPSELSIEPFKNIGFLDSPWLKLIKDFNFSPIPSNLTVRGDMDRQFIRRQLFGPDLTTEGVAPLFEKFWTFNRTYNLRWNLTKSLALDYDARANAIIDEPEGDIDTQAKRDSIWTNIKNLGRMKNFTQNVSATYRVPLDKFPVTAWMRADLRYGAGYTWTAGTLDTLDGRLQAVFGNQIQNNRDRSVNGKFDLVALYNNVKFLKEVNTPQRSSRSRRPQRQEEADTVAPKPDLKLLKGIARLLMSVRSIDVSFGVKEGTVLPGFTPKPFLFGLDSGWDAPGIGFLLGSQDPNVRFDAAQNGWITENPELTSQFTQTYSTNLTLRAQIEPIKDLRIQVDAKKTNTSNYQEIFRFDTTSNAFASLTPSRTGQYSISYSTIRTAFQRDGDENISEAFQEFERNRAIIRDRLNGPGPGDTLFTENSQDVLIAAFQAAYSGEDANTIDITPFPTIPIPNWRVDYAGLGKLNAFKDIFSSINITHGYNSTYTVGNYNSSLIYNQGIEIDNNVEDYQFGDSLQNGQLVPFYAVNQVSIREQFAPLIGINIRTKSRFTAKAEYRLERSLQLNVPNQQVTEMNSNDLVLEFGYTKADFKLPFRVQGRTVTLKNDLTFRMNMVIRNTKTVQRKIDDVNTITAGNINFQLRPTISYVVNKKLNLQFYFERNVNEPRISNSFKNAITAFGTQVRFSLAE